MKEKLLNKVKSFNPIIKILLFVLITAVFYMIIVFPINKLISVLNLDMSNVIVFSIIFSLNPIIVLLSTYISLRVFNNKGLKDIGMSLDKNTFKEILFGISLAFLLTGAIFIIELSLGWIKITGFAWNNISTSVYLISLIKSLILFTSVALIEEIFLRGYILYELEAYKGRTLAIIVTSILFGLFHLFSAIGTWAIYIVPFSLTLFGVFFALLFYLKKSLWIPIGFHFAWNIFEYEFFSLTGSGKSIFFATELTGPKFWVGLPKSNFGPEVGALGILSILVGILIVFKLKNSKNNKKHLSN